MASRVMNYLLPEFRLRSLQRFEPGKHFALPRFTGILGRLLSSRSANRRQSVEAIVQNPDSKTSWSLLFSAWVLVTAATLGSLFFSEIMQIPVCVLCWYQRIAMYPLVLILAIGLLPYDPRVLRYTAALTAIGWLIAAYHVLLVAGVIPKSAQPCVQGIPCSETHVSLLGFLNIPTLSLLTFSVLGVLLFFAYRTESS